MKKSYIIPAIETILCEPLMGPNGYSGTEGEEANEQLIDLGIPDNSTKPFSFSEEEE